MKILRITMLSGLALGLLWAAGCAMFNDTDLTYTRTTTLGRELMDLQAARDKGAITEEEYQQLKQKMKTFEDNIIPGDEKRKGGDDDEDDDEEDDD